MVGLFVLFMFLIFLIPLAINVFMIIELWLVFKKAGKEGWEALIPIYNTVVLLEITGLPMWHIALFFVPFGNVYALIRIYLELGYRFKQSSGFGVGLIFLCPVFLGILAFNKEMVYEAPKAVLNAYCSNCGSKINSNDKFCVTCGSKVEQAKDICLNCGCKLNKGDKFCTYCGSKI